MIGRADNILDRTHAFARRFGAAGENRLERCQLRAKRPDALKPFSVEKSKFRPAVVQAIFQFWPGPPGVERAGDAAGQQRGEKRQRPFRQIAHGDSDAVAFAQSAFLQLGGQSKRGARECFERDAFGAVNEVNSFAMRRASGDENLAQGRRRVLPNARRPPCYVDHHHLKGRAGRGQKRRRLGKRHGWKRLCFARLRHFNPPPI